MCLTDSGVENCAVRFVILLIMWQSRQLLELMKEGEEDKGGRTFFFLKHVRIRRIVNFVMIVCPLEVETSAEK